MSGILNFHNSIRKTYKPTSTVCFFKSLFCILFISGFFSALSAQCKLNNDFFSGKEQLDFDIHYEWGIISAKGGKAKLTTRSTTYKGTNTYKISLIGQTTGAVKKLFSVNDTLVSYVTTSDLSPRFYMKAAHEGKTDDYEEIHYTYPSGGTKARLIHFRNNTFRADTILTSKKCFYDPVSFLCYMRSLNLSNKGTGTTNNATILFTDEAFDVKITFKDVETIEIGKEKINAEKYTFDIDGKAFENKKESLTLWLSHDKNRIPVKIKTKLKVGALEATLKKASGCKNPADAFPADSKIIVVN